MTHSRPSRSAARHRRKWPFFLREFRSRGGPIPSLDLATLPALAGGAGAGLSVLCARDAGGRGRWGDARGRSAVPVSAHGERGLGRVGSFAGPECASRTFARSEGRGAGRAWSRRSVRLGPTAGAHPSRPDGLDAGQRRLLDPSERGARRCERPRVAGDTGSLGGSRRDADRHDSPSGPDASTYPERFSSRRQPKCSIRTGSSDQLRSWFRAQAVEWTARAWGRRDELALSNPLANPALGPSRTDDAIRSGGCRVMGGTAREAGVGERTGRWERRALCAKRVDRRRDAARSHTRVGGGGN